MGNSPKCYECISYREQEVGQHPRGNGYGWCVNKNAQGINRHKPAKPKERMPVYNNYDCKLWIDAESGYTRFEVNTGYKEPYDGTKINFDEDEATLRMEEW